MRVANHQKRALRAFAPLTAPLLGLAWVALNLVVEWLGLSLGHSTAFSMAIGGIDGMVVSVIVVAKLSQKFQAGMTGLLSGFSVDSAMGGGSSSVVGKVAEGVHVILDNMQLLPGAELMHAQLQAAVIQGMWTAVVVVVAALLVKWAQDAAAAPASRRIAVGAGNVAEGLS
jgi:hypothetical protein